MGFPKSVTDRVIVDTERCCALCHKFCGFKIELHHIKQKAYGGEDTYENCIPLCFDCHAEIKAYNPKHPKGKKYNEDELIMHRDKWYEKVKSSGLMHSNEKYIKLDKEVFEKVKDVVYDSGTIMFMRQHNFTNPFKLESTNPFRSLLFEVETNPEFEFLDTDLEHNFSEFISSTRKYLSESEMKTFPHDFIEGYQFRTNA